MDYMAAFKEPPDKRDLAVLTLFIEDCNSRNSHPLCQSPGLIVFLDDPGLMYSRNSVTAERPTAESRGWMG